MIALSAIFPHNDWELFFKKQQKLKYFLSLQQRVQNAYKTSICYPKYSDIFAAFFACNLAKTKVLIIGQDPYYTPKQADGLAFSCQAKCSPSLHNIIKNLQFNFLNCKWNRDSYSLHFWAQQGVLLLNTVLTVQANLPCSHYSFNWQTFTDNVLTYLNETKKHLVVLLWGNKAHEKARWFTNSNFLIIKVSHPSPLAFYRSFYNSKQFYHANEYLKNNNLSPINWF